MFRIVREVRPRWVLAENVPNLRNLGADRVLADLESEGYSCWPFVVGADDVGAPHRRKRVWIVGRRMADPLCDGLRHVEQRLPGGWTAGIRDEGQAESGGHGAAELADGNSRRCEGSGQQKSRGIEGARWDESDGCGDGGTEGALYPCWVPCDACGDFLCERHGGHVADCDCPDIDTFTAAGVWPYRLVHPAGEGLEGHGAYAGQPEGRESGRAGSSGWPGWPARPGERQYDYEPPRVVSPEIESRLDRNPARLPDRLVSRIRRERLKSLGNSVVSQIPYVIGKAILAAEATCSSN